MNQRHSYQRAIHGIAWKALEIPYPGLTDEGVRRSAFSLLETRDDQFVADHFASLSAEEGALRLRGLPAGDYDLLLREVGERIRVRIVEGAEWQGHLLGEHRLLEVRDAHPARMAELTSDGDVVRVRIHHADAFTRVHVVATRFLPEFDLFSQLAVVRDAEPAFLQHTPLQSAYVEGRSIGDEYRYIIERKYQAKFPGNRLTRPSLLLKPWAVHETKTSRQTIAEGQDFAARGTPPSRRQERESREERAAPEWKATGSLDYLARTSVVLLNLRPDSRGVIELERTELDDRQHLHVVLVHPRSTSYQQVALQDVDVTMLDRRLARGLDADRHFIQKRQVRRIDAGESFALDDVSSSRFEIYDSRAKLFALHATLVENGKLPEFQWLMRWHTFDEDAKNQLYSKYPCHEVHFFLYHRDREFFERVVLPYLRHKREKQFLDQWLLGDDLHDYLRPMRYNQLNVVERILLAEPSGERIRANPFWHDFARHEIGTPFVSSHFAEAANNLSESLFALALLDLPAEAAEHELQFEQGRLTLKPGSPLLILFEEIHEASAEREGAEILVNQHVYRLAERSDDRRPEEHGDEEESLFHDECLVQDVYGCQVVITNSTARRQTLELLLQIPQGAIPLSKGRATSGRQIQLEPFQTHKLDYYFYFPRTGTFPHYPVQVTRDERVVATAQPRELRVVTQLSRENRQSWEFVSQQGSDEEVLRFLRERNLRAVELDDLAWRMKDPDFFQRTLEQLKQRRIYAHTLWSYGVLHNEPSAIRTFLEMSPEFIGRCGAYLDSPLVKIDPEEHRRYEHLEYRPLVNPRAHPLASRREILNDRFARQYGHLMDILSCRRQLDDRDRMAVVYYLLLQDRIEEGQKLFSNINPDRLETRMQYDYFAAYLDFFQPQPARAQAIAARYAEHPVAEWRHLFAAVLAKFEELEGAETVAVDPRDRDQVQASLAATGPNLELKVEARQITISHQKVEELVVNFYEMDIELLFSRNPFVQGETGQFSWIQPHLTEILRVDRDPSRTVIPLPKSLRNRNVLVEVVSQGIRRWQPYYANSLRLQVHTDYGQVRVLDEATGRPLSTVYVKVYARQRDGRVMFHKDGYTDRGGRFDYASLSTNQLDQVQRFALLILSDEQGAEVRETEPPAR